MKRYGYCMAKEIEAETLPPDPRIRYPWGEWTNGSWWSATEGEDYTTSTESFRSTLFGHARKHDLKVRTRQVEGGLAFQFCKLDGKPLTDYLAGGMLIGAGAALLEAGLHG